MPSRPAFVRFALLSLVVSAAGLMCGVRVRAQAPAVAPGTVTIEQIMADPDWMGNAPEGGYWGDEGRTIYFRQKRQGSEIRDLHAVDPAGGASRLVPAAALAAADSNRGRDSSDDSRKVYVHDGDIFVKEIASGRIRQITRTAEAERDPQFLTGDAQVSYRAGDAFYIYDLASGLTRQAADVRLERDPAEKPADFDYLRSETMRILETLQHAEQEKTAEREHAQTLQKDDPSRPPLPFYLGTQIAIVDQSLSPSGRYLLLVTEAKDYAAGRRPEMPNYVTESGYTEERPVRRKVNRNAPAPEQAILLDLETHERHDLDLTVLPGIKDDPLAALRTSAVAWHVAHGEKREAVEAALKAPAVRPVRIEDVEWSRQGQPALEIFSIDNKDRWIATIDVASDRLVTQHRLTDPAWINWSYNDYGWMKDGRAVWYLSEESGYSQLYVKALDAPQARAITSGSFVVDTPHLDREGAHFYFKANREHPGIYEIDRVAATGGPMEQLTHLGGLNDFALSPDEKQLLITHSTTTRHDELYVQSNQPGANATQLTDTMSDAYTRMPWVAPTIVPIPSTHQPRPIYTRVWTPAHFNPKVKHPGVVFVHGAGYLQDAHQGWSYYFREFMFQTLLTQHGYVVIDMDYRASQGYGRAWRTAIYRNMGHPELEDLEDGVAWMVKNRNVDPKRVGIYGGSYGGFMTLMAMFRAPDVFAVGAAVRPVSDWANYNHEYTSDILNTPEIDPEAYERSGPIFFAAGLEHPLLICHGMQDNNVLFQDTVRLVQHLMELKKATFETAFFPLDPHDFRHATSWLYQYRRIFALFQRTIGGVGVP